ncbi:MAG: hypothetical protein P8186_05585 [Anaerolineae bacterium]|jgi:UDP:flavonoid glycosyltransferase YjiC (YdhE family)
MRVLITTLHFHPIIPLAQALEAAGHQVAIACFPELLEELARDKKPLWSRP